MPNTDMFSINMYSFLKEIANLLKVNVNGLTAIKTSKVSKV